MARPGIDFRFVFSNPKDLWGGETRQRDIAADLDEPFLPNPLVNLVALRLAALVVPQDRWSQHFSMLIQQHQTVHLTGQTDSLNLTG